MTTKIFIDRSRITERERCPRRRWLTYHEAGTGIVPARTPLPLAVGGSVHEGLAVLLQEKQEQITADATQAGYWSDITIEEHAVAAALADFYQYRRHIALDASEASAMQPSATAQAFQSQVIAQARELGMDSAAMGELARDPAVARGEFDDWLFAEQSALVEGLVRAYARRRLRPLLEQFEVLEVEREGEWKLSEWQDNNPYCLYCHHASASHDVNGFRTGKCLFDTCKCKEFISLSYELWFMSRPDALLRERSTNELYLLSYKTTAQWDVRKARDIEHDMQGLSEGVEVERRLGEWWQQVNNADNYKDALAFNIPTNIYKFLKSLSAPPRIHAIRYEFLLKGERWKDKELSSRLGVEVRSQKSPLVRQYVAVSTPKKGEGGYSVGDVCWSWDFHRPEDDRDGALAWQNWKSRAVWEGGPGAIREWIDKLDRAELLMSGEDSTIGLAPRPLGWKSPAQALGVTKEHPLDTVFVPPVTIYRNDDQLRDWAESTEYAERETAQHVAEVNAASDPGERRHLLNLYFPPYRHSCEYPSQCWAVKICFGGAEIQADPLVVGGGEYVKRVANHPQELVQIK